jgi:phosphoglycerate-specific signal transduction histidine kinase
MPRTKSNDTKSRATTTKKEIEERKKITSRLRNEALKEIQPIAIGSLAMVASTLSNQGENYR